MSKCNFTVLWRLPQARRLGKMSGMKLDRFLLVFLVGSLALGGPAWAASARPASADEWFLDAREAFRVGDRKRLDRALAPLKGHALLPYVELYQMHMRLDDLTSEEIGAYQAKYPGSLTAHRLQTEWLRSLGKRQRWESFGPAYAALDHDDPELTCYGLQYQSRSNTDAFAQARALWLTGQDLAEACTPLFAALLAQGRLGSADIHARQRLAVAAGNLDLVRKLNALLPASERIAAKRLEAAMRQPEKLLAKADFQWQQNAERELALLAIWRLARSSPTAAHEFWRRHRERFAAPDAWAALGQIAHQGARRLEPESLEWFEAAAGARLGEDALAWKARIALRFGHWATVLEAVEAMPPRLAHEATWRYWKGRALQETGKRDEAAALWRPLAGEFNYYGVLAREELGLPLDLHSDPLVFAPEALESIERLPGVQRMLKFYDLGLRYEGTREWIWAIQAMSDEELLLASEFARRKGLYDRAINTADKTVARHDFGLRFMAPYRDHLGAAARAHGLDEALVLALVRQESRFLPEARSRAGAVGLMQLMPPTAKWVARKTGSHEYRPSHIGIVDVNIKFGAYYLRYVLDRLGGLPVLAAAAYNAGPSRALHWRGPIPLEGAAYVESIPFTETRDYVKKVLANAMFYSKHLNLAPVTLKARLGAIPPRDASLVGVYASDLADTSGGNHEQQ